MALAWGLAWGLTIVGLVVFGPGPSGNVVYADPERARRLHTAASLLAYALPLIGWGIAVMATARHLRAVYDADSRGVMRCAVGWALGWLAAVPLGLSWVRSWDAGFFGLILSMGLAGAIGGTLTLPAPAPARSAWTQGWAAVAVCFFLPFGAAGFAVARVGQRLLARAADGRYAATALQP